MCTYCVQGSTVCQNLKGLGVKWSNKILVLLPGGRVAIRKLDWFLKSQESQFVFPIQLNPSRNTRQDGYNTVILRGHVNLMQFRNLKILYLTAILLNIKYKAQNLVLVFYFL